MSTVMQTTMTTMTTVSMQRAITINNQLTLPNFVFTALWAICCVYTLPSFADDSGMQTSIAVDITADTALTKETESSDRLFIREAEVMFYGPIDHLFDGQLSLAAHPEGGETLFEVHEAYIASSQLIPNSRLKVGQFFLGVGRLNQIHRHDWPFIEAPYIQKTYFDEEAAADSGVQWSSLLPLPFYLDVTLGATNGYTYGHSHDEGKKPRKPTHYLRLMSYAFGTAVGLNYLSRTSESAERMTLQGVDVTFKSRNAKTLTWLVQSETWMREIAPKSLAADRSAGTYVYVQHGFNPQFYVGLRGEYFTVSSAVDALNRKVKNSVTGVEPSVTWKPSEFTTLRMAYNRSEDKFQNRDTVKSEKFLLQTVYLLGAHPAHDF